MADRVAVREEPGHTLTGYEPYPDGMWIITTQGFLSVVRNLDSRGPGDALLVRGRAIEDLADFAAFSARRGAPTDVKRTPDADYEFRLTASRETLAAFLAERVGSLDYANFKDEIGNTDAHRAHVYMEVWEALRGLGRKRA